MELNLKRSGAPRTRLSEFYAWSKGNDNSPSYNNRWSVAFTTPNILRAGNYLNTGRYTLETEDNRNLLNYYADNVQLPSKQVTTGSITAVGSTYNYATSSTFSQISMDFIMPRSHRTRMLFERWISIMSSDANQFTDYYDDYVCPNLLIFKWERGGGPVFALPESFKELLRSLGISEEDVTKYKDDQLVGIYDVRNVFPYNIGGTSLTNAQAAVQTMNVQFYYERYRFYGATKFDDDGRISATAGTQAATSDIGFVQA